MSELLRINVEEQGEVEARRELPIANIGDMLRRHRLDRNLTLEQVANELRIDARQLDALENNHYELFHSPVFVQGHLRSYARFLELDPAPILSEFNAICGIKAPEIVPIKRVMTSAGGSQHIPLHKFAPVIIGVVGLVLAVWLGKSFYSFIEGMSQSQEVEQTDANSTEIDIANRLPDSISPPEGELPMGQTRTVVIEDANGIATTPSTTSPDGTVANTNDGNAVTPTTEAQNAPPAETAQAPADASTVRAVFRFKQDSWIEVVDPQDKRLISKIGKAGNELTAEGAAPLRVVLGNASAVEVEIDGQPFQPPLKGRSQVARFEVTKANQ